MSGSATKRQSFLWGIMSMKKALLGTTAIVGASLLAANPVAAKPVVNIGGAMDFQVGWTSQDREGWSPTPGGTIGPSTERGYSFFQKTNILINASDVTDLGMKWDFRVKLNADADGGPGASNGLKNGKARDASDAVTLALSDFWGQVTVGADHPVYDRMTYGSGDAVGAAGTGGVDGNWARWFNYKSVKNQRFEDGATTHDSTTSSKIQYVTPRIAGFQAGVTYALDSLTIGRFRSAVDNAGNAAGKERDWWSGALTYNNKFGGFDVGLSADLEENGNNDPARKNGLSGSFGTLVGIDSWKFGARWSKKFRDGETLSTDTNTEFDMYDLGVGYEIGPWAMGVSYMHENEGSLNSTGTDTQDTWALSGTYSMGGGLQLYTELFHNKDKAGSPTANLASNNEGTGLISGVRVKF
jgi:outer membrane protein OmpU